MTEAKDIYKTLLVGSFLSSVWMQSQKSEHFTAVLAGKVKDTCQWATSCTSWRSLLCQLLSNPLPSSRLLCDTLLFLILENICSLFAQKVLYVSLGLATLELPAVQWTTRECVETGCPGEFDICNLQRAAWAVHLLKGVWMRSLLSKISLWPTTFIWLMNTMFLSIDLWAKHPFRVEIVFSLDRTYFDTSKTVGCWGSTGLVTECRWYVWVSG